MTDDPMIAIRASFFEECEELVESLHDALQLMEQGSGDAETVNVVFRAVHSIKGGAGAFGLNDLVDFAHRFETVLDDLRSGRLVPDAEAIRLFFQGADLLHDHVRAARSGACPPDGADAVLRALEGLPLARAPRGPAPVDFTPMLIDLGFAGLAEEPKGLDGPAPWIIDFTPRSGLYTSGNEPLLILRNLASLGEARVTCSVPGELPLSVDAAELPLLSWRIELAGEVPEMDLREAFDFVADVSDLSIRRSPLAAEPQPSAPLAGTGAGSPADETGHPAASAAAVQAASNPPAAGTRADPADHVPATVRVDLERVDRLVNLVGELVISHAMLAQSVSEAGIAEHGMVMGGLEAFQMLTRDIQDSVMMIRAQPVKPLFQRMARTLRETSLAVGKTVRLLTEGETTEIDKTVIERLSDPLTHMVRNAVDHGIEAPAARAAAGKPAQGTVSLSASHRAGRVVIEIADDGAGIDRDRVLRTAVDRGLVPPDAQLGEAEIDNLLFLPGFSTASSVSSYSGRGVGLDVVKSAITGLGGRISIFAEPGRGTRFSISLPLTLAVLDGMVVRVAGQTLVVPLSAIMETVMLAPGTIRRIGRSTELLHIRGQLVPLFDLGVQLGFREGPGSDRDRIVILIALDDGGRAALVVDAILDQRQVVIKGLSRQYGRTPGVAAATILGDGQVALILDPSDLVRRAPGGDRAPLQLPLAG